MAFAPSFRLSGQEGEMKFNFATCLMFAATTAGAADLRTAITVYVRGEARVPPGVEVSAMRRLHDILAQAGIKMAWKSGEPPAIPDATVALRVEFKDATPVRFRPSALGMTEPFTTGIPRITVLFDRVQDATIGRPQLVDVVLSYVLAHEIGHALTRTDAHSENGVMKAHWDNYDFDRMTRGQLRFTDSERELMERRIEDARRGTQSGAVSR